MSAALTLVASSDAAPKHSGFDYSSLTPDAENVAFHAAARIRQHMRTTAEAIISIGIELLKVRKALDHGEFGRWLTAEFPCLTDRWGYRTASRYMAVAEVFRNKLDIVSDLKPTTIYALASPSTPAPVREDIIRRREEGVRVSDQCIHMLITEAKRASAETDHRRVLRQRRKAQNSPAALKRAEKERQKAEERRQEEEEQRRLRKLAVAQIVDLIRECVGERLPELHALLEKVEPTDLWGLPERLKAGGAP